MSLEESMAALAESNLKLAKSFDNYANVVTKFGLKIENDNAGKTSSKSTSDEDADGEEPKKPRGRPPGKKVEEVKSTKKPKDDFDDEGDEESKGKSYDFAEVKAKLMEVKNTADDKTPALKIIGKYGYDALPELEGSDEHYAKIMADCEAWLKKNA